MDIITLPLLLRWLGALLLTMCLMCLCLYLLQNGKLKLTERTPRRIKKLESTPLTRQSTAHLLQIDGDQTFIAITTPQGSTIYPLQSTKRS